MRISFFLKVSLFFYCIVFFTSCISRRDTVILQRNKHETNAKYDYIYQRPDPYKVLPYDIIQVNIYSLYPTLADNIEPIFGGDRSYNVFEDGTIDMPLVGKVLVEGKTEKEIEKIMTKKISKFFDTEKLHIRVFLGGVVNFIGEVNAQLPIGRKPINIIEAISKIGGLPFTTNMKKIEIMRQYPKGTKSYFLDVTNANILSSKHYWLKPNDVIRTIPLPQKFWGIGTSGYSIFNTFASTISTIVSLFFTYFALKDRL